jgi:hypothetical protein
MTPRRFMRRATNMLLVIFGTMAVYMGITAVTGIIVRNQSAAAQSTQPPLSPGTDIPAATTAPANPPVTVLPAIPAGAKVGDLIQHPSLVGNDIALRVTDTAPPISAEAAMQVAQDTGYPYALGGLYEGREVTVTARFGRLTYGRPGDTTGLHGADGVSPLTGACAGWIGPCNWPVQTCHAGQCSRTDKVIPRIENRPYWILDYANVIGPGGVGCDGCPEPPVHNHTVLIVDALDKFVLMGYGYTAP